MLKRGWSVAETPYPKFGEFTGSQEGAAPKVVPPGTPPPSAIIGAALPPIDGPLKTTGTARYASDYNSPRLVYVVPVRASVASGKIRSIDSVNYQPSSFNMSPVLSGNLPPERQPGGPRVLGHRGDTDSAFASAAIQVDEVYVTPAETHNPMEMHATVAVWDRKKVPLSWA